MRSLLDKMPDHISILNIMRYKTSKFLDEVSSE